MTSQLPLFLLSLNSVIVRLPFINRSTVPGSGARLMADPVVPATCESLFFVWFDVNFQRVNFSIRLGSKLIFP
jgi:hypothetical protein